MKACKNCKHMRPNRYHSLFLLFPTDDSYMYGECFLSKKEVTSDYDKICITGKVRTFLLYVYAKEFRKYGECGLEGELWEQKESLIGRILRMLGLKTQEAV